MTREPKDLIFSINEYAEIVSALEAENEQLREEEQHRRKRQSDKDKLRDEIERLRAALEEIQVLWCKGETVQIGAIARRAREPKP